MRVRALWRPVKLYWDQQLADFLRQQRGENSLEQFARETGVPRSTLHRVELVQHQVAFSRVELIVRNLGCTINHIVPGRCPHCRREFTGQDYR